MISPLKFVRDIHQTVNKYIVNYRDEWRKGTTFGEILPIVGIKINKIFNQFRF
jgi:hypothetical protein